ncbi:MAG: hypothetical protein ACLFS2_11315 [Halochromatium sp.]|uniref:hypothetical protein n=1 Tax=Halochromatium sp. TaxID=2049430 RepID=UPI00397A063A
MSAQALAAAPERMDVDHVYPDTFDALLFGFCLSRQLNPSRVEVVELEDCIPWITDEALRIAWQRYHQQHAQLRLVPTTTNLRAKKRSLPWHQLLEL